MMGLVVRLVIMGPSNVQELVSFLMNFVFLNRFFWPGRHLKSSVGAVGFILSEFRLKRFDDDPIRTPGSYSCDPRKYNYDPVSRTLEPAIYGPREFWDPSRKMRLDELVWWNPAE